ncbi:MAG: hypothetical protein LBL49_09660 [Clostridiales Family XIII bacterium]|jgi:YbbR domain-containing protein|nr:hypothetical protein [Clostridiales Family XIII bacterium]
MLRSNTINKIIAVAVALVIWAYVITVVNPPHTEAIKDIPVRFTNMDILGGRNLTVSSDVVFAIDVTVEGKRADVRKLNAEDFDATVDLIGWSRGEHNIPVEVVGPDNVEVITVNPMRVAVNIEDLVSISKPINIEYTEAFPEGKEPGFVSMVPNQIEVSGAKSQVDNVDYISVKVDSSELRSALRTFNIMAQIVDREGQPIYSDMRLSQREIEVAAMLCDVKEIPLNVDIVGDVPPLLEVTSLVAPKTVYIRGAQSAIDRISLLTAAAVDISRVDVTSKIPIQIELPMNVELADKSSNVGVEINIKGISTKEFSYTSNEIMMEGVSEGYAAHINDSRVTVRVFGAESVVSELTKGAIRPYVDISEMEDGDDTANLPIRFAYETSGLKRVEAVPERVLLNIYEINGE